MAEGRRGIIGVMTHVTQILSQIESGDPSAAAELLPLVYDELRKLAAAKLAYENPDQTLQATALVHEAYLRLVDADQARRWNSRAHFFRAAAEAMRRILVDNARRKRSLKRGGEFNRVELDALEATGVLPAEDVLALSEAVEKLAAHDTDKAELVKLRFFGGLSVDEAASVLGISRATADRHWQYAKTWLYCELTREQSRDRD
jgi:RNA polymerase sigma factor (TIGR02999 family)